MRRLVHRPHQQLGAEAPPAAYQASCCEEGEARSVRLVLRMSRARFALLTDWSCYREKIEDYLRFLTHAGETRFPIFAWGNLRKLSHSLARLSGVVTLTLEIV